jgi:hypothetical protein
LDIGLNRPLPAYMLSDETGSIIPMNLIGQLDDLQATQRNGGNAQVMIGSLEAGSRDALERMEDLSLPLKNAVSSLTDMVETFMPTTYIPDLTFFIARSCVDGPCQKKLETVLKRSFNPYCHPYLSGRYRDEDSMKRCFCDQSIENTWSDYKKYCTEDYKRQEYEQKEAKLIPACQAGGE